MAGHLPPDDTSGRALMATAPSTAARDRVVAVLSDRFAHGDLDVDEFERRVTIAQTSGSLAEVDAQVASLVPAGAEPAAQAAPTAVSRALLPAAQVKAASYAVSIMGGTRRVGAWSVPRKLNVVTFMGGAEIDFRDARLPSGAIDMQVFAVMGGVQIIVPPTLQVEASGFAIMGGFEPVDRVPDNPDPATPVLRVHGFAMMGGVVIEMRLPGETEREARKRRKQERKRQS